MLLLQSSKKEMKLNQQDDDIASTISGLKWLSVRNNLWDDEEPLMNKSSSSWSSSSSSSSLNYHSSASTLPPPPPPLPASYSIGSPSSSPSISLSLSSPTKSTTSRKRHSGSEYELKNAQDVLIGSISAVINFLGTAGVPKPSCEQLQKNLNLGRYFAVLKRVQDYIQCIPSKSEDETLAKIHLTVGAWEALCRFKAIEHKRAYKNCYRLRYELKGSSHEIKQAIALQVKIAEQCTACQKKLYLVQKWQRHLLQKMKRSSPIEPQGYQPIRCL